jgi:hypothetical protein
MRRREYYTWLRWCRLPLTTHVELLRFTIGVAFYRCVDGSGRHSRCYRAELALPILRLVTVIKWGPRPIPHSFNIRDVQGFGSIGGRSLTERHRGIEELISDDDE